MTANSRVAAISRRDQICEILINAPGPMLVKDIAARMPYMWLLGTPTGECRREHRLAVPHWRGFIHVGGQCFLLVDPAHVGRQQVRADLVVLERRNLVERLMYGTEARWRYVGARTTLEDMERSGLALDSTDIAPDGAQ